MADAPFPDGMVDDIRAFLASDYKRQGGRDIYDEVFRTRLFFPLQRKRELAWMMRQARAVKPKCVMEIGADKGGGLYHWIKCHPTVTTAIACEIRGTPYSKEFERAFPSVDFMWLPMPSLSETALWNVDAATRWAEKGSGKVLDARRTRPIDCMFIDGDKARFLDDFRNYLPFMSRTGRIFLHDVQDSPGPKDAMIQLEQWGWEVECFIDVVDWDVEKVLMDDGARPAYPWNAWLRYWQGKSCGVAMVDLARNAHMLE